MENKGVISKKTKLIIAAVVVLLVGIFACSKLFSDKSAGKVTVSVVALDGSKVAEKTIKYNEDDTLDKLVEANFKNVEINDGFLYSIETLTTPADWSTFIALWVNNEMSPVGICEVVLSDGMTVSFIDTEMAW